MIYTSRDRCTQQKCEERNKNKKPAATQSIYLHYVYSLLFGGLRYFIMQAFWNTTKTSMMNGCIWINWFQRVTTDKNYTNQQQQQNNKLTGDFETKLRTHYTVHREIHTPSHRMITSRNATIETEQ